MKALIGEAAEMMCLGYTDHEIVRILRIPASQANELIEAAEEWNYNVDMEMRHSTESYVEEIEFPRLKLPFAYRLVKFFCALNSVVKWLFITIWVVFTLFLFGAISLLLIGVGSEIAQYLLRTLL